MHPYDIKPDEEERAAEPVDVFEGAAAAAADDADLEGYDAEAEEPRDKVQRKTVLEDGDEQQDAVEADGYNAVEAVNLSFDGHGRRLYELQPAYEA